MKKNFHELFHISHYMYIYWREKETFDRCNPIVGSWKQAEIYELNSALKNERIRTENRESPKVPQEKGGDSIYADICSSCICVYLCVYIYNICVFVDKTRKKILNWLGMCLSCTHKNIIYCIWCLYAWLLWEYLIYNKKLHSWPSDIDFFFYFLYLITFAKFHCSIILYIDVGLYLVLKASYPNQLTTALHPHTMWYKSQHKWNPQTLTRIFFFSLILYFYPNLIDVL